MKSVHKTQFIYIAFTLYTNKIFLYRHNFILNTESTIERIVYNNIRPNLYKLLFLSNMKY